MIIGSRSKTGEGESKTSPSVHSLYTRVTVLGLLIFALGMVLFIVLGLVQGSTDDLVFFAASVALALIVGGSAWRYPSWGLAVAAAFSLANLVIHRSLLIFLLRHPTSAFDFVLSLTVAVGLLVGLAGGATAFIQQRSGTARDTATRAERRAFGFATVLLLGLVVTSAILGLVERSTVSAQARAGAIEVDMRQIRFEPERLDVPAGRTVKLFVKNSDFTLHTFTVAGLEIDREVLPRSERVIVLTTASPGAYQIICKVPGHENMTGILVVSP